MRLWEPGEYAVLGLLYEQPRHGYALAREFAPGTELRQVVRLEISQLYATLKKLELLGLIAVAESSASEAAGDATTGAARTDKRAGLRRSERRIYTTTSAGRVEFETWLAKPVQRPRDLRLTFLLKLFFALRRSTDDALALLGRQEEALAGFHATLSQQLAQRLLPPADPPTRTSRFGLLVLRARLRQTEAAQAWLGDLRTDLVETPPNRPAWTGGAASHAPEAAPPRDPHATTT